MVPVTLLLTRLNPKRIQAPSDLQPHYGIGVFGNVYLLALGKVEKIWKGSLDLIPSPSPSVKIQIMGGKVCLRCEGKTLLGIVSKLLKTFPANNLNFHWRWRWWDPIQAFFLNLFYFTCDDAMLLTCDSLRH